MTIPKGVTDGLKARKLQTGNPLAELASAHRTFSNAPAVRFPQKEDCELRKNI